MQKSAQDSLETVRGGGLSPVQDGGAASEKVSLSEQMKQLLRDMN